MTDYNTPGMDDDEMVAEIARLRAERDALLVAGKALEDAGEKLYWGSVPFRDKEGILLVARKEWNVQKAAWDAAAGGSDE